MAVYAALFYIITEKPPFINMIARRFGGGWNETKIGRIASAMFYEPLYPALDIFKMNKIMRHLPPVVVRFYDTN